MSLNKFNRVELREILANVGIPTPYAATRETLMSLIEKNKVSTFITNSVKFEKERLKGSSSEKPFSPVFIDLNINKEIKTIYHMADIHFRNDEREQEYMDVIIYLIKKLKSAQQSEPGICVIAGDVVHNCRDIRPRAIKFILQTVKYIAAIMPVIVIAGNHDLTGNLSSIDIIESLLGKMENVFYLSESGTYIAGNLCFHTACLNDKAPHWTPVRQPNHINIGLFHGEMKNCPFGPEKTDLFLLGDIHERSIWSDKGSILGYPGSLIQQNFGEEYEHGIIQWDLETKRDSESDKLIVKVASAFIDIPNRFIHYSLVINEKTLSQTLGRIENDSRFLSGKSVYLKTTEISYADPIDIEEILSLIRSKGTIVNHLRKRVITKMAIPTLDLRPESFQEIVSRSGISISDDTLKEYFPDSMQTVIPINIQSFSIRNAYGIFELDMTPSHGINIICEKNGAGKSSLVKAIEFALLFEKKGAIPVLNIKSKDAYYIKIDAGDKYMLRRMTDKSSRKYILETNFPTFNTTMRELLRSCLVSSDDYLNFEQLAKRDQLAILNELANCAPLSDLKLKLESKKGKGTYVEVGPIEDISLLKEKLAQLEKNNELYLKSLEFTRFNPSIGSYDASIPLEVPDFDQAEYIYAGLIKPVRSEVKINKDIIQLQSDLEDLPSMTPLKSVLGLCPGQDNEVAKEEYSTYPKSFDGLSVSSLPNKEELVKEIDLIDLSGAGNRHDIINRVQDQVFDLVLARKWNSYTSLKAAEDKEHNDRCAQIEEKRRSILTQIKILEGELHDSRDNILMTKKYEEAVKKNAERARIIENRSHWAHLQLEAIGITVGEELFFRDPEPIRKAIIISEERSRIKGKVDTNMTEATEIISILKFIDFCIEDKTKSVSTSFVQMANSFYDAIEFPFQIEFGAGISGISTGLLVSKMGTEFDYRSLSRSEKCCLSFGIKYALHTLSPVKIDTLFIDESLDVIDIDSVPKIEKMLELLLTTYSKIILITHRPVITGHRLTF